MDSYSPIDNVCAQEYPALLITAGLNDPRVAYWEPAKWVAKMRELKTNDEPLLMKVSSSVFSLFYYHYLFFARIGSADNSLSFHLS